MMKPMKTVPSFLLLLVIVEAQQIITSTDGDDGQDYHWKDYTGEIPNDALPGGKDKYGVSTFIGQTYYDSGTLVPGEIHPKMETLFYAMSKKQMTTKKDIKILCARNHQDYEWVDTDTTKVRFLTHKHLISGGHFKGYPQLIGRTKQESNVIVGKILIDRDDDWFAYTEAGEAHYVKADFQVLTYNPKQCPKLTHTGYTHKSEFGGKTYNIYIQN